MKKVALCLALLVFNQLFAAEAVEDSLDARKIYEIEGIRVVGESMAKKIGSVDIRTIEPEDINTDTAIGSLIRDLPGLFLSERGKGESIVRFRGFQDRHIRVYIDGMPISDGYFGNHDLHLLPSNNVSAVHLIKGPVSHQYGFNTMGGILNIVTDNLNEKNALRSRIQYSSHGSLQTSFNSSYGIGRSQLYLNASFLHVPGFILPAKLETVSESSLEEGGERRTNSDRNQYAIAMRYITDIGGMHTFSAASGYSFIPNKGNPPSIYIDAGNRFNSLKDWGKFNASASVRSRPSDDLDLRASVYYDRSEDTYIRYLDHTYRTVDWESLIRTNTVGTQTNINYTFNSKLDNDIGFRLEQKSYDRTGGPGYTGIWIGNDQTMLKFYHNIMYPVKSDRLSVIVGNALSSYSHSQIDGYDWYWEPQAAVNRKIRNANLSLAYGRSIQFPTMRQLFSSTSGNPYLKPEKGHKIEASISAPVSFDIAAGTIKTNLFYNRVANLIERGRDDFYNLDRMSTYGGELNIDFSLLNRLSHGCELSYMKLDEANSSLALIQYPEVKLRFSHQFKQTDNLHFSLSSSRYGESLTYYGPEDYFKLPSYWTHDFGVKYFLGRSNITLNVTNLLDSYYEPQYGYPAPGREAILAVETKIF